ncbi:MAG: hypothetical protein E1N59_2817 [Puniceicoccaceae bacterium 5H]|nr:MAG: hypothetical protein E1N59_2817 [Puniceicoccaceae bacterium 5H]
MCVAVALCSGNGVLAAAWQEDLPAAMEQAQQEGRYVFLAFLGLDWSVASKQWWQEVGQSEVFQDFADERLVLVLAEGTAKKQPKEDEEAHHRLVQQFDIKSYPTFLILAPDGSIILTHGTTEAPADEYVAALRALLVPLPTAS